MTAPTLSWLHLSDLHFKRDSDWKQDVVLQHLMRDVIAELPGSELAPDAVFVTGDIAFSGQDAEYRQARLFFDEVAQRLDHHPSRSWFLVPGNHDVDRGLLNFMQKKNRAHFTDLAAANELLSDSSIWADFAARQQDFIRFTRDFLGPKRAWDSKVPWCTDFLVKDGLKVAVLCLNSAWAAQDDDDKGRLLIGEYQAREALKKAADADLRFGLFHHPWDWLHDFDRGRVRGLLSGPEGCHFLLRGHLHETEMAIMAGPSFQTAELAAGACWQGAGAHHSVTVGRLDFATRKIHLHVFTYSNNEGGFWTKDSQLSRDMPEGVWQVDFPKQWQFNFSHEEPPPPEPDWVPHAYYLELERTCGQHENLIDAEQPLVSRLRDVYVPVKTDWLEPEKRKQRQPDEESLSRDQEPVCRCLAELVAHAKQRHFLVVGEPGTGKSTFIRFAVVDALETDSGLLPIYLSLKDFGAWLEDVKGKESDLLVRWATQTLAPFGLENLVSRLGQGRVLWLLDGLDEIFNQALRLRAVQVIGAFIRDTRYGTDRLCVTSRPHALEQTGVRGTLDLSESTASILALDGHDQRQFLLLWFEALYSGKDGAGLAYRDDLWQKMARNTNLVELRSTRLLLSMIATLYHLGKDLPEPRADLYEKAVWNLLQRRYGPHGRQHGSDRLVREMRQLLMKLARWMLSKGAVRDICERDMLHLLNEGHSQGWRDWADAEEIAVDLGTHSGLLTIKGGRYSFIHLGFQEFLAARSIAFAEDHPLATLQEHFQNGAWREVILLTVAHLYESGASHQGAALIKGLLSAPAANNCSNLVLAVEAATQVPPGELGELETELVQRSLAVIEDRQNRVSEKNRFKLGLALGYMGDPRLGLEKKANWVSVDSGFRLARFPVTNADFKDFIDADGYNDPAWWDEDGLAWLTEDLPDPVDRYPRDWWDKNWNAPNQPVIGVCWHEARAFCRWLTARFQQMRPDWLSDRWGVRLPTNAEWGQAVGEGKQKYPWVKGEPDETRANYAQRLNRTSPVGLYPNGGCGELRDLAGNVWEWNLDLESENMPFSRGGSWLVLAQGLAASFRSGSGASLRYQDFGFRCCLAPEPF